MANILLCACGLTPQVVTETLYALICEGGESIPDEVHILTTRTGYRLVANRLVGADSPLQMLLKEYGVKERVICGVEQIHVLGGDAPLDDIRTTEDNATAAQYICDLVKSLVQASDALHVSIAGGRKTMGYLLGMAMQLFGREGDALSHVLIAPAFESNPEFFYPPLQEREYHYQDRQTGEWLTLSSKNAGIQLARLPVIRLGDRLDLQRENRSIPFEDAVAQAKSVVELPMVTLNLTQRSLSVGNDVVGLTPMEMAVYHALLRELQTRCTVGAARSNCRWCFLEPAHLPVDLILKDLATAYGYYSERYGNARKQLSEIRDIGGWFRQKRVAINKKLGAIAQGDVAVIHSRRQYGATSYGVCIPRNKVRIVDQIE